MALDPIPGKRVGSATHRPIIVGLTGSIGMGKSTTAGMFADAGIPVHSADAAVHRLYAGRAAPLIEAAFPGTVRDAVVDRSLLGERVLGDRDALQRLEAIIHPLVRDEEAAFVAEATCSGAGIVVLDIPLLFETGGDKRCDRIVVVTAPLSVQRERVLARPRMSEKTFEAILAKQMPDCEKRLRADFLVDTSQGLGSARREVGEIIAALSAESR